eukprot:663527-Amorphochlora_amoeboformis.AAC.1
MRDTKGALATAVRLVDVLEDRVINPMEPPRFADTVNVRDTVKRAPERRELGERMAVSPVGEGVREEVQEVGDGNKE